MPISVSALNSVQKTEKNSKMLISQMNHNGNGTSEISSRPLAIYLSIVGANDVSILQHVCW